MVRLVADTSRSIAVVDLVGESGGGGVSPNCTSQISVNL